MRFQVLNYRVLYTYTHICTYSSGVNLVFEGHKNLIVDIIIKGGICIDSSTVYVLYTVCICIESIPD